MVCKKKHNKKEQPLNLKLSLIKKNKMSNKIIKVIGSYIPDMFKKTYRYNKIMEGIKQKTSRKDEIVKDWINNGRVLPAPDFIKQNYLSNVQKIKNCDILVETGTYVGEMINAQLPLFDKVYSIELSPFLYKKAKKRFKTVKSVEIIKGDSGKVLPQLLNKLDGKIMFWLDGHYSAGITALGDKVCPIFEELKGIFKSNKDVKNCVILIDDARLFNGEDGYPTIEELKEFIKIYFKDSKVTAESDIITLEL